jgi:hypothetical protein
MVHDRDECRHLLDVDDLAERDDFGAAEVALEQGPRRAPIGLGRLANKHWRQIDSRLARAHDLHLRIVPIHKLAAP